MRSMRGCCSGSCAAGYYAPACGVAHVRLKLVVALAVLGGRLCWLAGPPEFWLGPAGERAGRSRDSLPGGFGYFATLFLLGFRFGFNRREAPRAIQL